MITGGSNFITAAYILFWVVLGAYSVSIWVRMKRGK